MEYSQETLIKQAIRRLEALDEVLKDCMELLSDAYSEKQIARHLFGLGCEKEGSKSKALPKT